MNETRNIKKVIFGAGIIYILMVVLCLVSTVIHNLNISFFLKFIIFQFAGIILPGWILSTLLLKKETGIEWFLTISWLIGFSLAYPVYFLTVPWGLGKYINILYFIIDLILILISIKKRNVIKEKISFIIIDSFDLKLIYIFFLVLALISTIIMGCSNFIPDEYNLINSYYQDHMYFIGNTAELAKEFPPVNFRAFFQSYSYHYFYSIQQAVIKLSTNIPAFELGTYFSYLQVDLFLSVVSVSFIKKLIPTAGRYLKVLIFISFFLVTGYEKFTSVAYVESLFFVPNGIDFALGCGFVMLICVLEQLKVKQIDKMYLFLAVLSFFLCIGTKGPVGIVYGSVCAILFLIDLFKSKNVKRFLIYAVSIILIALLLVFLLYWDNISSSVTVSSNSETYQRTIYTTEQMAPLVKRVTNSINSPVLSEIILMSIYVVLFNPPLVLMILFVIILKILGMVRWESFDVAILLVFGLCILAVRIYAHSGLSQVYFFRAVVPLLAVFSFRGVSLMLIELKELSVLKYLLYICISVVVLSGMYNNVHGVDIFGRNPLQRGISYLTGRKAEYEKEWPENSMTKDEFIAYRWLKENTKDDAKMICDTAKYGYSPYAYCPGVFSERYFYVPIEGYDLCQKLLQGSESAKQELKRYDVTYVVITNRISENAVLNANYAESIYENSGVRIYRILGDGI